MKKIIIGFLSAAAVAVGLSSCDLDAVVYSEMTEVNYPKTEADAQSLLDGMYGYLKTNSGSVNMSSTANTGWGWPYWSIGQIGYFGLISILLTSAAILPRVTTLLTSNGDLIPKTGCRLSR